MQIPQEFHSFEKKTLVVITDHIHAKLYTAFDRDFEFVEELKTDYPSHEGGDRTSMVTSGGGHSAEMNEKDNIIGEDHLFRIIAADLHKRLQNHEFDAVIIAAGPEVHQLEKLLHPDVHACVTHFIPKLLTRFQPHELFEHLELDLPVLGDRS